MFTSTCTLKEGPSHFQLSRTTILILFSSKHKESLIKNISLEAGGSIITPSRTVRNLGVEYDVKITFEKHVNNVCRSCYYQLYNIGRIRKYLTHDAAKSLVHSGYFKTRLL